jgi:hypothetical protein
MSEARLYSHRNSKYRGESRYWPFFTPDETRRRAWETLSLRMTTRVVIDSLHRSHGECLTNSATATLLCRALSYTVWVFSNW